MKPCGLRQKMVMMAADGTKTVVLRCTHPRCEHFSLDVDATICDGCDKAIEPPPEFGQSQWPACDGRKMLPIIPTCCGGDSDKKVCNTPTAPSYNQDLTPSVCRSCIHRFTKS